MKDMPLFTTENGIASLTLKEIPYSSKAYIRIQDSKQPELLLQECVDFCHAVGAENIYGTGHVYLSKFERHCRILRMRCSLDRFDDIETSLFPVTERTLEEFRSIYNEAMRNVPNASYLTVADGKQILEAGSGYFVHNNGQLLGIGIAKENRVDAIVSLVPGEGKIVFQTLCHALCGAYVEIEVAEENIPAMRLYEKLHFIPIEEVAVWYKIV